jgi:hypothetical protein
VVAQEAFDVAPRRQYCPQGEDVNTKQFFVDLTHVAYDEREGRSVTKKAYPKECIQFLHAASVKRLSSGSEDPGKSSEITSSHRRMGSSGRGSKEAQLAEDA